MGKSVSYEYSPAGKLLKTTDIDGVVTNHTPDENGLNNVVTDKMGNKRYLTYDKMTALTSETDFMGNTTLYEELINTIQVYLKNNNSEEAEYFVGKELDVLIRLLMVSIEEEKYKLHFGL